MLVDINSKTLLVLQAVRTFLFSLSSFWPLADRFTSAGTRATERGGGGPPLFKWIEENKVSASLKTSW